MSQTILDKLNLKNDKNILIQGLPSSIEKQFSKVSFAKNLTPLLKTRKIDFALIFAVSENQLNAILGDIKPALKENTILWVAHPKVTSKISTDLNRDSSWNRLSEMGYETIELVSLDHVWQAFNFKKNEEELIEEVVEVKIERKTRKAVA
ncbi:MAG TPA: hypothetical protein VF609_09615 [Flavisolibacter sp.]|jgi:hypothetical protein